MTALLDRVVSGPASPTDRAGGQVVLASVEVVPGVVMSEAEDTEGNTFVLTQR
jgi:predicted enzyme related to lactoylglutathione lyase